MPHVLCQFFMLTFCHLNNFMYTLIDHTFDYTVVDNYHMYSLYSQWDNGIIMGSTFKFSNFINA